MSPNFLEVVDTMEETAADVLSAAVLAAAVVF